MDTFDALDPNNFIAGHKTKQLTMDRTNLSFVETVERCWKTTEEDDAQSQAMAILSSYTSQLLGRVQKLDSPLQEKTGTQNTDKLCDVLGTEKVENKESIKGFSERQQRPVDKANLKDILEIGQSTVPLEKLVNIYNQDVVSSARIDASKQTFFGFIPGSGHLIYAIADYIASLSHVMPLAPFVNAGACDIEESVISWVKKTVGYPDTANGVTVSGTSMGAVVAFSAARDHLLKSSNLYNRAVVYVADHTHLSGIRALRVVGLGDCVYRYVPSIKHRLVAKSLEEMIKEDINQGLVPFLVIASMGGTCVGALDPLSEIREITQKHNVWFHVDASYGGFLLLDETVKARCAGIAMSDSITLDFHKGLSAPCGTATLLIREGHILASAMSRGSAPYIQSPGQGADYSPLELSFEYTRPFRAFPVWFMLKNVGTEAIQSQITEKIKLTKYVFDILSQMENVSVYMEPDLTIVAFRCSKGDDMTKQWLELINQDGTICTTSTTIEGKMYIRMCILSFRTHLKAVEAALSCFKRTLDILIGNEQNRTICHG